MVRTRGLGRALGRVIRRALGREVSRDADDAPWSRRPTTSARRQQKAAPVAEDVDDMDQVDEEVYELPEETAGVDVPIDAKGFSGGPHDTSVLQDYVCHVATKVWSGEVFIILNIFFP